MGVLRRIAAALPMVNKVRERRYARRFVRPEFHGWFYGVFQSFEEARAAIPPGTLAGLDHASYADAYEDRLSRVFAYDYPMLFWLGPLLASGASVFDLGGHVGVTYFGYGGYLPELSRARWCVCDLPEVIKRGRKVATLRGAPASLEFTSEPRDADGFDVLFAAGVLQYIEQPPLAELLGSLQRPPEHLLLNKLPLHAGDRFVTLQNARVAVTPQYVFNEREFMESLTALGYQLVDRWEDYLHSCRIPFHHQREVEHYAGFYFRRP
jgi:putative methyltransferase (TIGR04325 family)